MMQFGSCSSTIVRMVFLVDDSSVSLVYYLLWHGLAQSTIREMGEKCNLRMFVCTIFSQVPHVLVYEKQRACVRTRTQLFV